MLQRVKIFLLQCSTSASDNGWTGSALVIQIKKYANRRLYNSSSSSYVNLDDIASMIRDGDEVQVVDASSGEDLTREILMQVVLETLRGVEFFPTGMLHRLIRASGDSPAQKLLRKQLITGMDMMSTQLDQWEAMTGALKPSWAKPRADAAPQPAAAPEVEEPPANHEQAELDALRERLSALEHRLQRS